MGKSIALIDDSSVMRSILRKAILMAELGVTEFLEAANGQEGLTLIEENQGKLALIITDLHMPKFGGLEMLRTLKEKGVKTAPIVVISTVGDAEMQTACKELGAVAFLKKPFSHEDIEGLLSGVLKGG